MDYVSQKSIPKKTTLDTDYNKQTKHFINEHKQLPSKIKSLKQLSSQYNTINSKNMLNMSTDEINSLYKLRHEISDLKTEIKNLEDMNNMTDFYLKTGKVLIEYYNSIENHFTENPIRSKNKTNSSKTSNNYDLLAFLSPKTFEKVNDLPCKITTNDLKQSQRADLYEQYLVSTDPHYIMDVDNDTYDDYCDKCGEFRELLTMEALLVCQCGIEVPTIIESDKPSYKDPPHENMYFAYKRINHFKEQLSHFQAKETTRIPDEVYDTILYEFKKEKKTNLSSLTRAKVKHYLQKHSHMGYNKYYENINQILCHLNGIKPLSMGPDVEEQLCNMFHKIEEPFEKHCPSGRTNFLSYSYVIYKFCQLLGYDEYLPYFNLLKSKDKLHQQDKIWKKMCSDLGWKYYSSY
jgi:hypothetical protein